MAGAAGAKVVVAVAPVATPKPSWPVDASPVSRFKSYSLLRISVIPVAAVAA